MSKINQLNELVYSLGHRCKVRMQLQAEGTKLNMLQSLGDENRSVGFQFSVIWWIKFLVPGWYPKS